MKLNLILAWLWILLGFIGGSVLGVNFHREDWMGGYGSHRRRLYRLGHISFFGLAIVNLLFYFTAQQRHLAGHETSAASWAFILGAGLAQTLYSAEETHQRRQQFKRRLKTSPNFHSRMRERWAVDVKSREVLPA